ncbi:hypothetical protein DSECCO2_560850 [anaerobic digester metagenome]
MAKDLLCTADVDVLEEVGRHRRREFADEIDRSDRLPAEGVAPADPVEGVPGPDLVGAADGHTVLCLDRDPVFAGDQERPAVRCPNPAHLAGVHLPAGHLCNPAPALRRERGEVLREPRIGVDREFVKAKTPDPVLHPQGHDRAPVDAERARPEVFQVVDVEVAAEVVVRKIGGELQEVLLLADLVRLLFVRCFGILLEVRVVVSLKSPPDVDEVRVKDRGSYPGADVAVGYEAALKERHVDDLADQRPGERLQPEHLDLSLDPAGDILRRLLVGPFVAVEDLDEAGLFNDLPDDPVPVPVQEVAPRCPDFREGGDELPEYSRLGRPSRQPHASAIRSAARSSRSAPPAKRSADV